MTDDDKTDFLKSCPVCREKDVCTDECPERNERREKPSLKDLGIYKKKLIGEGGGGDRN